MAVASRLEWEEKTHRGVNCFYSAHRGMNIISVCMCSELPFKQICAGTAAKWSPLSIRWPGDVE